MLVAPGINVVCGDGGGWEGLWFLFLPSYLVWNNQAPLLQINTSHPAGSTGPGKLEGSSLR